MTAKEISDQLRESVTEKNLLEQLEELVNLWGATSVGLESVEPILRFMEMHPSWDFGMPGPLVHFVEQFYKLGYEEKLIESVRRVPTAHTVWMLNRLINGEKDVERKKLFVEVMANARTNPMADQITLDGIAQFLSFQTS